MRLCILGTSAAYAARNDGCSSYLLSTDGEHYLIDTGPGCVSTLQDFISFKNISGIFISHLHPDHYSDIFTLRYALYTAQKDGHMKPSVPLYLPPRPGKIYRLIRSTVKAECSVNVLPSEGELKVGNLQVKFIKTEHPADTRAFRFEHKGKVLVYTSDTLIFDKLVHFSQNADLLLAEATLQDADSNLVNLGHMTARDAGRLGTECGAKKLVLTHLWPEYKREITENEAGKTYHGPVTVARKGLVLEI